jgi:hypothetical protein
VRLDLTKEQAATEAGSLRLQASSGGYSKTISIAQNFVANPAPDDTVDVHYENVPTTASYSLTYIGADGSETNLVQGAPYDSLKDNELPPEASGTPAP